MVEKAGYQVSLLTEEQPPASIETLASDALRKYESGAVRSNDVSERFDLICPTALRLLAAVYSEGLLKYGIDNWTKGMDISETLNRALAHINAYLNRRFDEPHLPHAIWNLFAVVHFTEMCRCHLKRQDLASNTKEYGEMYNG